MSIFMRDNVIDYLPKGTLPKITYTRERVESVQISKQHYEERKKIAFEQVNSVIQYTENEIVCRSNTLLYYFGENEVETCGVCDVCLLNKRNSIEVNMDSLEKELLKKLKIGPQKVDELLQGNKHSKELAKLLNFLTDSRKLNFDGLTYSLN